MFLVWAVVAILVCFPDEVCVILFKISGLHLLIVIYCIVLTSTRGSLGRTSLPASLLKCKDNILCRVSPYEALTPVRHKTRYNTGHNDTAFLEKLGHDTVGIQPLIN